jgi:hypothetical protein
VLCYHASRIVILIETFQSLMAEGLNHSQA